MKRNEIPQTKIVIRKPGKEATNTLPIMESIVVETKEYNYVKQQSIFSYSKVNDKEVIQLARDLLYFDGTRLNLLSNVVDSISVSVFELVCNAHLIDSSLCLAKNKIKESLFTKLSLISARFFVLTMLPLVNTSVPIESTRLGDDFQLSINEIVFSMFLPSYHFVFLFSPGMSDDEITACLTPFYRDLDNITESVKESTFSTLNVEISKGILNSVFKNPEFFNDTTILTDRKLIEYIYRLYIMKDDLKIPKFTLEQSVKMDSYITDLKIILLFYCYCDNPVFFTVRLPSEYSNSSISFSELTNSEISETNFSSLIKAIEYFIHVHYVSIATDICYSFKDFGSERSRI